MFEIFARSDYKKIVSQILSDWEKLAPPPADTSKLKIKLLPFRKVGLHSLLNFMIASENQLLIVIKMPRYQEGKLAFAALENEAAMLRLLGQKGMLAGHLPQLYDLVRIEDMPVLVLKAYPGEMLHHFLDKEEDLTKLEALIGSGSALLPGLFNEEESKRLPIDRDFIQKYIKEPLRFITEYYPQHIIDIEKRLKSLLDDKDLLKLTFPTVCMHSELNPWNILKEKNDNLILLDWEDALPQGLPLLDVYNYFTVCFRILFVGESKHSRERKKEDKIKRAEILLKSSSDFIDGYCEKLKIPPALKDLFFIIFAINATRFFLDEKRREINYAMSWLSLLLNASPRDCFENYVKNAYA